MTDELLIGLFKILETNSKYAFKIVKDGLPEDVKPVKCMVQNNGLLEILIESEEFEKIEFGKQYPILTPPTIEKKYIDGK